MSNLLIAGLVLLYTMQAAFCNLYSKYYPGKKKFSSPVYSVVYGLVVALATWALARFRFAASPVTFLFAAAAGAALTAYNTLLIRASDTGPFSVLMTFNLSGGILIPVLWSVFHDGDVLGVWQYLAIAVLLVSFLFLNWEKKPAGDDTRPPLRFYLYSTLLAFMNGAYEVLLNEQKKAVGGTEDAEMIVVTFAFSALLALVILTARSGRELPAAMRLGGRASSALLAAALSAASAVNLLMFSLARVHMAVLFSLNIGGVLVVSVLWSAIGLREKFPPQRVVGLCLAAAAIFALSIL